MASIGLQATVALGLRVRRRDQPAVSVSIVRVAVLGVPTSANFEPHLCQGSDVVGK